MKIIELVRKDEHDAVVAELQKHLKDANRGAEVNSHINQSLAGQVNKLRADNAELLQRLEERTQSHLAASARDVQTIQRQSVLLDRLATALDEVTNKQADWKQLAEQALSAAECFHLFWGEGFGTAAGAEDEYLKALAKYRQLGGVFSYAA